MMKSWNRFGWLVHRPRLARRSDTAMSQTSEAVVADRPVRVRAQPDPPIDPKLSSMCRFLPWTTIVSGRLSPGNCLDPLESCPDQAIVTCSYFKSATLRRSSGRV
jgi:hypothetical protein